VRTESSFTVWVISEAVSVKEAFSKSLPGRRGRPMSSGVFLQETIPIAIGTKRSVASKRGSLSLYIKKLSPDESEDNVTKNYLFGNYFFFKQRLPLLREPSCKSHYTHQYNPLPDDQEPASQIFLDTSQFPN